MTTLHRFHCHACGAHLTEWLEEISDSELVSHHASSTAFVPRGYVINAEQTKHYRGLLAARWMVAPMARAQVALHSDSERTIGCCGLSYRHGQANLVCAQCSVEVAMGYEDCCGPHWAAFVPEIGHEVELHPDEDDEPRLRDAVAHLDAHLARASGVLHDSNVGEGPRYNDVCCDEPAAWERYAPRISGVSLTIDGEQLIVHTDSLGSGGALVVATPRVMLVRLLCASITPWGEVDLPLTWRADDVGGTSVGEVSVGHDVGTSRVVLITRGRDAVTRAVVMSSSEWLMALARLRTSLSALSADLDRDRISG